MPNDDSVHRDIATAATPLERSLTRRTVACLAAALVTLHNAEEALTFERLLPDLPALLPPPLSSIAARLTYPAMLIALGVVSLLAVGVAVAVWLRPRARWSLWLLLVLEATMAINALSHALVALAVVHGYAPGVVTALLVNVPFAVYCFRRAAREQWVSSRAVAATVPAALIVHGPVLIGGMWLASVASR